MDYNKANILLSKNLQSLSENDKSYWSFRGNSNREYGHGLFQYPAMMVPQITKTIIDKIIDVRPDISSISDPFVGSGTVMTEAMLRGFSFSGTDINPLAILLCQVKSGPFFIDELNEKSDSLKNRIRKDKKTNYEIDFPNINKWFTKSAIIYLSKIRRSIQAEKELWARRFFWVALAETIRLTSNSRTSTFKLHTRTMEDIYERKNYINVLDTFYKTIDHNLFEYNNLYLKLKNNNFIQRGYYKQDLQISFADVREITNPVKSDVIITSPPYGDNKTTVPYGQHSYLPLQWIDFSDINDILDKESLLRTTNEIDSRSLGGHDRVVNRKDLEIVEQSENLRKFTRKLKNKQRDKTNKVITFFRDIDQCLDPILQSLNTGGIMVWVLGNRRVGGKQVPLDGVLSDLFEKRNVSVFCELKRKIPSKRMASKNNLTKTMSDEVILLMRKDS
jgi:site-specific DNA-methyltransferase (cytosine-N4-specific)